MVYPVVWRCQTTILESDHMVCGYRNKVTRVTSVKAFPQLNKLVLRLNVRSSKVVNLHAHRQCKACSIKPVLRSGAEWVQFSRLVSMHVIQLGTGAQNFRLTIYRHIRKDLQVITNNLCVVARKCQPQSLYDAICI